MQHRSQPRERSGRELGAAAVEFALILPVLLLVIVALYDLGRAISVQVTLTQAAREGARLESLNETGQYDVTARTIDAAPGLGSGMQVDISQPCTAGSAQNADAVVITHYTVDFPAPLGWIFGSAGTPSVSLSATGRMPCLG